eukprot:731553_1
MLVCLKWSGCACVRIKKLKQNQTNEDAMVKEVEDAHDNTEQTDTVEHNRTVQMDVKKVDDSMVTPKDDGMDDMDDADKSIEAMYNNDANGEGAKDTTMKGATA